MTITKARIEKAAKEIWEANRAFWRKHRPDPGYADVGDRGAWERQPPTTKESVRHVALWHLRQVEKARQEGHKP